MLAIIAALPEELSAIVEAARGEGEIRTETVRLAYPKKRDFLISICDVGRLPCLSTT